MDLFKSLTFFHAQLNRLRKVLSMNTVQHTFLSVQFSTVQKIEINFFLIKKSLFSQYFFLFIQFKIHSVFFVTNNFPRKKTECYFIQMKIEYKFACYVNFTNEFVEHLER